MDSTEIILRKIFQENVVPFWQSFDFWIFVLLSIASLIASLRAFSEARKARYAAYEAGKTVKLQTITIELSEIVQKLEKLDTYIDFSTARDLLSEMNRKIRRLVSPFQDDDDFKVLIEKIKTVLDETKKSLTLVRPVDDFEEEEVTQAVYNATESYFAELSGLIAELMGLIEKRTIEKGA
jgi:hypothetical protein